MADRSARSRPGRREAQHPFDRKTHRGRGAEFEHDRQAVDASLDLLCQEGLSEDERNIVSLDDALVTLCERLEIEALSNQHPQEAALLGKLQTQFKKLHDYSFGECTS